MEDGEIVNYMKTAGLLLPIHKRVVRAHFNMEDTSGTIILDQGGNNYHGNLVGGPTLVSVCKHPLFLIHHLYISHNYNLFASPKFFFLGIWRYYMIEGNVYSFFSFFFFGGGGWWGAGTKQIVL